MMKKLIRKIVNWAYGVNVLLELDIMDQAKDNLGIIIKDVVARYNAKIDSLEREIERLKRIIDTSPF